MSNFGGPVKNSRQQNAARERKKTTRAAPNGYLFAEKLMSQVFHNFLFSIKVQSTQHSTSFEFTFQLFLTKNV
jgi:hypothetical protein